MKYNNVDIMKLLDESMDLSSNFIIEPIGNHNIGRHLVYKVINKNRKFILKIYYVKGKREREINSLITLKGCNISIPEIINYGEFNNHEWLLMSYINGKVFENILGYIGLKDKLRLFMQLGEALGKLHSYKTFDYGLGWGMDIGYGNFKEAKIKDFERRVSDIKNQNLPDKKILIKIIDIIRKNFENVFDVKNFRLTHNDFDGRNILVSNDKGGYNLKAIIDFEQSYPDDYRNDLANLYFKYFIDNKFYEKSFLLGYNKYMKIDDDFYKYLNVYLMIMVIEHCSWSYEKAKDYYLENIQFLKKFLIKS